MKTLIFLTGGVLAGTIAGLLLAPSSGISTRNRVYYILLDFFRPVEKEGGNTYNLAELSENGTQKLEELREAISQNDI